MKKVDRLGWAAGLAFEAHGLVIGVRTTSPALLPEIEKRLPPGAKRSRLKRVEHLFSLLAPAETRAGLKRFNILYNGPVRKARSFELAEVLDTLEKGLVGCLATHCRETLFLRGGVVEFDGRALAVVGAEGSGTTTLLAALQRAGGRIYSDGYALIEKSGKVVPFGSRLKPVPLGWVLVTSFREGARFHLRRLTQGEAMMELLSNTTQLAFEPRRTMTRVRRIALEAAVLKGFRGEAEGVASSIWSLLRE
jgi:hypothetical protein